MIPEFCTVFNHSFKVIMMWIGGVQSYLHMSHSSLKSDSLGLDLSSTARSGGAVTTGREENVNYMLDLSDDEVDVIAVLFCSNCVAQFY